MPAVVLAACACACACGSSAAPASRRRAEPLPPLGALTELAPRGSELVVVMRPIDALRRTALATIVELVMPDERMRALRDRYGVDVRTLTELVVCTGDDTTLVLARGPFDARRVIRRVERRMTAIEGSREVPFARRVGLLEGQRHDVVALAADAVAVMRGPPGMMEHVLRERLRRGARRGALSPRALRELAARHGRAPAVVYAPRPIRLSPDTGVGLLLARERALAVALDGDGAELLARVELVGEFPSTAEQNFVALVRSIGSSDLGRALGLDTAAARAEISVDLPPEADVAVGVRIALRADAEAIGRGVREVFVAELADLFGERRQAGRVDHDAERSRRPEPEPSSALPARPEAL